MQQENLKSNLTVNSQLSEHTVIKLFPDAYFKIIYHSLCFGNRLKEKDTWSEVMGFLSGTVKDDHETEFIHVTNSWPISHGDSTSVTIDNYGSILQRILIKLSVNNETILGWYHSHPSYGLFMSTTDFETQLSYQRLYAKAIAIVFDQTLWSSIHSGLEAYRLQDDFQTFEKIPVDILNYKSELNPHLYRLLIKKIKDNIYLKELDYSHE